MLMIARRRRSVQPVRRTPRPLAPFAAGVEPLSSPLPTVEGAGLSTREHWRLNRARNLATSVYAADVPDAGPDELARVGRAAAADALRTVLRDRPAICCDEAELVPCVGCLEASTPVDPGDIESDPSTWPAWTDERWTLAEEPAGRLTLVELIDLEADRLRGPDTAAADLMASVLEDLSRTVRAVSATNPWDVAPRLEVLARDFAMPIGEPEPELMASGRWA